MLAQSRAIDQSMVRLSIEVTDTVDGKVYRVNVDDVFDTVPESNFLTIPIVRGHQLDIVVTWSEFYKGQPLFLAQAEETKTVPIDAEAEFEIVIDTESYLTSIFDDDDDEISNLDERNNETDPRVPNDSVNPIVPVPVRLRANIPEQLMDVASELDETLDAVAVVEGATVQLNREGNTWTGESNRPANSSALVNYSFYSSIRPNVKLATWEGRRDTGEAGTTVEIQPGEYDDEIDNDGDGITNLQEVIDGTHPDDGNDPPFNPCDISDFEIRCNTDSDGDGSPDSVETADADQDEDLIPDYLESRNDDADEDGFNAELDEDESDPCVPSVESLACDDTDPIEPSPLSYEYFAGQFNSMPDFGRLTSTLSGTAETFSLPANNGETSYALQYTGQLLVEQPGQYIFYTESDDGSLLYIDGTLVVNNDGTHSLAEESGTIALTAGLHSIVVEYFQNDGSEALTVSWSSSTIAKEVIPETVLFAPIAP